MSSEAESNNSVDRIKARIIYGNSERYRRGSIGFFTGLIVAMLIAWIILGIPSINKIIPAMPLRWFAASALFVSLGTLAIVIFSKNFYIASSIMSIFFSLLFIPTLFFTGGFISPFSIAYILMMLLAIILVDIIPSFIGDISALIIICSYIVISLLQKTGFQPVIIDFVQPLLEQDAFFWLVFITVSACFIHGFIVVKVSSRNIRETMTQLIVAYRYVAKGTSLFISNNFFPELLNALKKTLQVKKTYLLEWTNLKPGSNKQCEARIVAVSEGNVEERVVVISEEFKLAVDDVILKNNTPSTIVIDQLKVFDVFSFVPVFHHWEPVYDQSCKIVGIIGAADSSSNASKEVLVLDIVKIFSSRVSAELARRIEEQKRLQMQNLLAQGQKMQAIGQLSSSIAHDFNNILNGIFGFASLISRKADADSLMYKYSNKIIQLGKNAGGLISQLLAYSRHTVVNTSKVHLNQIIEDCIDIIKCTNKKQIDVECKLPEVDLSIDGDTSMIQSAILNLLINAFDAIPHDGIVSIELRIKKLADNEVNNFTSGEKIPGGKYAVVSIVDTGCGIPEENFLRIFEPFYTTKGIGKGTGLGLAAVFGCMESHHGYINIESAPTMGSTFQLYFPIDFGNKKDVLNIELLHNIKQIENIKINNQNFQENQKIIEIGRKSDIKEQKKESCLCQLEKSEENGSILLSDSLSSVTTNEVKKQDFKISMNTDTLLSVQKKIKTIMIVDDECSIVESLSEYLACVNIYNVIACNCGKDALEKYQQNKNIIDVIIMDMLLPDLSGKEVLEIIRKINPDVKVIIITGYSSLEDIEYVKKLGVEMIFDKPFDFKVLDITLTTIIEKANR